MSTCRLLNSCMAGGTDGCVVLYKDDYMPVGVCNIHLGGQMDG